MNNGAFGENFPYSNFHDLNMDWIIKIAKDFLDQYTNIQNTITEGLEGLDNKATELENLLQEWYDTHSEDIANQLADALANLENWYTTHEGYLDQYVTDSITAFNQAADQKAAQTIASIPSDYTTLSDNVNNISDHVDDLTTALNNCDGESENTIPMVLNEVTMATTGDMFAANGYARCDRIKIPINAKKVFFPDMYVNPDQTSAGWAIYDSDSGRSVDHFIRGGQLPYIDFTDEEIEQGYYYSVSGYSNQSTWTVYYEENNYKNTDAFGVIKTVALTAERYINYTSGNFSTAPNTNYRATQNFIWIPFGCKLILFPEGKPQFNAEVGWAVYSKRTGNRPDAFIRGGQTAYIIPEENERYFCFTSYDDRATPPETTSVYFYFGSEADIAKILYPTYNKTICFVGDSVTYGYDDDNGGQQLQNPWTKQVSEILKTAVYNAGYSGATLGQSGASGIVVWVNNYINLANQYDILGVMIGVNDCFNRSPSYPLGTMDDNVKTTFYGALKIFWKGMVEKYPPKNGKKLFCMIYPSVYSDFPATWKPYQDAIKEVAEYYAIPVLDLSECSGISPHSDPNHEYWRDNQGSYSPHLTQDGANVVAPIIANFIKTNMG